ncbi:hypothetical protein [Streptomonospora wellingtoniae]|uniref:ESX-1 secretion-associated protein n=1 Tax=Streptomonospora wellingtoniae TaxID=3075544 RepID=A0ABU2KT96_9ACTN|nr:hypothetical protein [Streptomonospora sp. DSM 45055]MDT0302507.1 hypothetical protein [Streptomonospora sp. DSM 45055]
MGSGPVGANPGDAVERGGAAEAVADTFTGLSTDFQTLVEQAGQDAAEPLCREGYAAFLELAAPWIRDVQEYGTDLAGNIAAAGERAGAADDGADAGFRTARALLAERIDGRTSPYSPRH